MEQEGLRINSEAVVYQTLHFAKRFGDDNSQRKPKRYKRRQELKPTTNTEESNQSEDSPNEEFIPHAKISVLYTGTLSQRLNWDQDKLDHLVDTADLRSAIRIKSTDEMAGPRSYDSLGEVAIWKRLGNPLDLFRRRTKETEAATIDHNSRTWEFDVLIKDQVMSQKNRDQNNGKFVEAEFVDSLNGVTANALKHSIIREKIELSKRALEMKVATGLTYVGWSPSILLRVGIAGACGYFAYSVGEEFVSNLQNGNSLSSCVDGFLMLGNGVSAYFCLEGAYNILYENSVHNEAFKNTFLPNVADRDISKHVVDGIKGLVYLCGKGKRIVDLTEEKPLDLSNEG